MDDAPNIGAKWDSLTATQKRRLLLRIRGLSLREIARIEEVHVKGIYKSLTACMKKLPSLRTMLYDARGMN